MKGLLYKDFLALKGQYVIIGICIYLVGIFALRFFLPANNGEADVVVGIIHLLASNVAIMSPFGLMNHFFSIDATSNMKNYYMSIPISKKDYVESKYVIFIIIMYVMLSVSVFSSMIVKAGAINEEIIAKLDDCNAAMLIIVALVLIRLSFGIPAGVLYGAEKAYEVGTYFGGLLFIIMIPVLYFVRFDKFDYSKIDTTWIVVISMLMLPASAVIYYLSYRYTLKNITETEVQNGD